MPTLWIVPHTHWDREWYHPAARFQLRLARLAGQALGALERGALPGFLLDGQSIVLDDIVAIRPAFAAPLREALRSGRLEAGPWFVLPDELLVSAEALVRNLACGRAGVRARGGEPMSVGYSPDAFGHSGMLPALLNGFGIGNAVVWRGFASNTDLHRWQSADGSEVLLLHLPAPGYEYGANLPAEPRAAATRWKELRALLESRARSPHWLVLNGADHHAPQTDVVEAAASLERVSGMNVKVATLGRYMRTLETWVRRHAPKLPLARGELRDGRSHAWALQDTHGTRLYLKQQNAECQRLLERIAEPLAALALVRGEDLRDEVRAAWRELLANHPHDSICGTSHDAVHREMLTRFARCRTMALESSARALDAVTGRDANAARRAGRQAWRPHVVVFNTVPRAGARLVEANVALFRRDVLVGPGSAKKSRGRVEETASFALSDAKGRAVPYQILESDLGTDLVESPGNYPDADEVEWRRVLFSAELPSLGVTSFAVIPRRTTHDPRPTSLTATATSLANDHLQLTVAADGTLTLVNLATREHYGGIGGIEDQDDFGDSYTSSPRGPVRNAPDNVAVRLVHAGPLRGQLEIIRRFDEIPLELAMQVVLEAGSRSVSLWLEGMNLREDHRLRLAFPSGIRRPRVLADAHFGPVARPPTPDPRPTTHEFAAPTSPMQRWVAAAKGRRGLAVISDGLPQYEARADGTVLVTVLRGTGQLSRLDLPERPGHAGWPTPTPEGQCVGPFAARLAVMPCKEQSLKTPETFDAAADEVLVPPLAMMQRALLERPAGIEGPALRGEGLVFSAMKPADAGSGIVLRCYNARGETVAGAWSPGWKPKRAESLRLDETVTGSERIGRDGVRLSAGPRAVMTTLLR